MSDFGAGTLRVSEGERRFENLIRAGLIVSVDHAKKRAVVRIGGDEKDTYIETKGLPWVTGRAGENRDWDPPEPGEQVLVLSPSGDPAQGWIVPGAYTSAHGAPSEDPDVKRYEFKDGCFIEYDRKAHKLRAILPAAGIVEIEAPGGVRIKGDVTVDGDVVATGISLVHHLHGQVYPGSGVSGEPVP